MSTNFVLENNFFLVFRYFVANNAFQRYVAIENIWVSQGKAVTWVRLGGKYLYNIHFSHFAIYLPKLVKVGGNLTKF